MPALTFSNLLRDTRISPTKVKTAILAVAVSAVAIGQVFPPTYPGQSPIPGGPRLPGGSGIPIPGRKGKQSDKTSNSKVQQPLPNFRGQLKQMDEKSLSLELGDNRVLDFKRTGATKFFKAGDEVKPPKFNIGDQLSVEAQEEPGGYMTAVNVYWEKAGSGGVKKPAEDTTVDTWKDVPRTASSQQPAERAPEAAAPVKPDADDPGPPRLRRGGVADPSREVAAAPPASEAPN